MTTRAYLRIHTRPLRWKALRSVCFVIGHSKRELPFFDTVVCDRCGKEDL